MIELLTGFALGRATKGINPVQVCIGVLGAIVLLAVAGGTLWTVWTYAPQAAEVVTGVGVVPSYLVDYLRIVPVADGDVSAFAAQLPKRMMIFMLALLFIGFGLVVTAWILRIVLMSFTNGPFIVSLWVPIVIALVIFGLAIPAAIDLYNHAG